MRHRDALGMAAVAALLVVLTVLIGDRIGVNGGQGWDGMAYTLWARDFAHEVLGKGVTVYHAQRQLPPAIVHYLLGASDPIRGFVILDGLCLVVAAYLWGRIALVLAWSRSASWAGFAAIFTSFAVARHALYYPTLTDGTAFALGMAMVWGFVARRPLVLWVVALLGAFTWPALPPLAIALMVLRRDPLGEPAVRRWLALATGAAGALVACGVCLHYLHAPVPGDEKWAARVPRDLLVPTLIVLAVWTCAAWFLLARGASGLVAYARSLRLWPTVLAVVGAIAIYALRALWVHRVATQGPGPTGAQFACELALEALRGPAWGLVHHVVYFGPTVLIAIGCWPRIARTAAAWGPGAVIAAAMIVAFAIGSESRQWLHLLPMLVALTIAATHDWWTPRRAIAFAVLGLAWSKLWWPLRYVAPTPPFEWPNLRYFMQQGPWASNGTFLAHLAAAVVTSGVLVSLFKGRAVFPGDARGEPLP